MYEEVYPEYARLAADARERPYQLNEVYATLLLEHVDTNEVESVDLRYCANGYQAQGWCMRHSAQEQNVRMSLDPTRVYRPEELVPRVTGSRGGRPPANAEKLRVLEVEIR